jgi:chromatin segregation and condensation protein Rec8/ScpA/Scc1 (kleisin family)
VPVADYMDEVTDSLRRWGGRARFVDFFRAQRSRPRLVGIFLAILELIKRGDVEVTQESGLNITVSLVSGGD